MSLATYLNKEKIRKYLDLHDQSHLYALMRFYKFSERDQQTVINTRYGGGNPAEHFLESLKNTHGTTFMFDFKKMLRKLSLWEAHNVIHKYNNFTPFSKVTNMDMLELAVSLTKTMDRQFDGWITVAEFFGMSPQYFTTLARCQNNYSPSNAFFNVMNMRYPQITLEHFAAALKKINLTEFYDIVKPYCVNERLI